MVDSSFSFSASSKLLWRMSLPAEFLSDSVALVVSILIEISAVRYSSEWNQQHWMLEYSPRSGTAFENTSGLLAWLKTGSEHTLEPIVVVLGTSRKENE